MELRLQIPSRKYGLAWYFQKSEEAARAYDTSARMYHDPKARLNFPPTNEDNIEIY